MPRARSPRAGRRAETRRLKSRVARRIQQADLKYPRRVEKLADTIHSYLVEPKIHGAEWALRQAVYYTKRLDQILGVAPPGLETYTQTIKARVRSYPWPAEVPCPLT